MNDGTTAERTQFVSTGSPTTNHDGVTQAIVDAVAELTGTDPTELDPLQEVIDVDALEELFAPKLTGRPRPGGVVVFTYGGCTVTVHGTDRVTVRLGERSIE